MPFGYNFTSFPFSSHLGFKLGLNLFNFKVTDISFMKTSRIRFKCIYLRTEVVTRFNTWIRVAFPGRQTLPIKVPTCLSCTGLTIVGRGQRLFKGSRVQEFNDRVA